MNALRCALASILSAPVLPASAPTTQASAAVEPPVRQHVVTGPGPGIA